MTIWLVIIAVALVFILAALERGNSIKAAQIEAENERREIEKMEADEERKYETFFALNGHPHPGDSIRVAVWAAQRKWSLERAREFLLDAEVEDGISQALDEAYRERISIIQKHGWQASYVALAFTPEQRSGQKWRPVHGMIWKDGGERYFLNLTDMSSFADGGCSLEFPLEEKSLPQHTFTIEKAQEYDWDTATKKLCLVDID